MALTWRDVAAPDLGTSIRGYETFGRLLDNAASNAQAGLTRFDQAQDEIANRQAMENALAIRDTDAYRAALNSGSIFDGVNRNRVSAQTLQNLDNRVGTLLNQATGQLNFNNAQRTSDQAVAYDALTADIAAARAARTNGKQDLELEASIRSRLPQVGAGNAAAALDALDRAQTTGLGWRAAEQGIEQTAQNMEFARENQGFARENQAFARENQGFRRDEHTWQVNDRNDLRNGQAAAMEINSGSYSPETALNLFSSGKYANLTPGAKMAALQQLNSTWGNIYAPAQLAAVSGVDPSGGVAGGGMPSAGGRSAPANYTDYLQTLESGGIANPDQARNGASSATGRYQFTGDTWLRTIKKANPAWARGMTDSQLLAERTNPQRQAQVEFALRQDNIRALQNAGARSTWDNLYAMHHFGSTGGVKFAKASGNTPISQILTPEQIKANPYLQGMTKDQVLRNWGQRTGQQTGSSPYATQVGATLRTGQERMGQTPASQLIDAASKETGNVLDSVDMLREGRFKDVNPDFLAREINRVVDESRGTVGYRQAATILNNSLKSTTGLSKYADESMRGGLFTIRTASDPFDRTRISNEIARASNQNGITNAAVRENDIATGQATLMAAQRDLSQAQQAYQFAFNRRGVQPGVAAQLPILKARMDAAQAAFERANAALARSASPNGRR